MTPDQFIGTTVDLLVAHGLMAKDASEEKMDRFCWDMIALLRAYKLRMSYVPPVREKPADGRQLDLTDQTSGA